MYNKYISLTARCKITLDGLISTRLGLSYVVKNQKPIKMKFDNLAYLFSPVI